jgi:hypothetical protein
MLVHVDIKKQLKHSHKRIKLTVKYKYQLPDLIRDSVIISQICNTRINYRSHL